MIVAAPAGRVMTIPESIPKDDDSYHISAFRFHSLVETVKYIGGVIPLSDRSEGKMKTKSNLNRRFLLCATLFLLVVDFSLGLVLMKESTDAMKEQIGNRMLDVSNTAASMLDGDVLRDIQAEDADTPEYKEILETLTFFQDNIELKYIYCIRDMGNKEFAFSVDPTVADPGTDRFYCDTFERADRNMYENKKAYYEKFGNRRNSR